MKAKYEYDSAIEAIQDLCKKGHVLDFNLGEDFIFCKELNLKSTEFEIMDVFQFEEDLNPIDDSVVYAIKSNNNQLGILVTVNAIDVGPISQSLITKLKIQDFVLLRA